VRAIDWNVTARMGRPYLKRFVEERELTVMLVVDLSRSMAFGSVRCLKQRMASELCALLAFAAIKNHDKVGLLIVSDHVEHVIPPKRGPTHVLRVIREVLAYEPRGRRTDLPLALEYVSHVLRRKAVVFVISDFFCPDVRQALAVANTRHDVIGVHLVDPREMRLPPIGWLRLEDAETGGECLLHSAHEGTRRGYEGWAARHRQQVAAMTRAAGVDLVEARTDRPLMDPLVRFFRMRALRH
jgi:uncharacterized protein (DUF58 family)